MVAPFLPDEEKVAAIRAELPATGAGIYLDTATAGPLPVEADRAMREWSDWELRVGRAGPDASDEFQARLDEARGTLAALLVAPTERVWLAPDPAVALLAEAETRRWRPGDRIVLAASLDPAVSAALARLAGAVGAELRTVEVAPGGDPEHLVERLSQAVKQSTALVVVPHVSPVDGWALPIEEIANVIHRQDAWLGVDGSLAAGAIPVDVASLGVDLYVAAGDRWLLGPSGSAAVFVSETFDPRMRPAATIDPLGIPEAGLNRTAVVGLGRSAAWLAMQVGLDWAFARTHRLVELCRDLLAAIPGVSLAGQPRTRGALFAFRVAGWPAVTLREELGRRAFAVVGLADAANAIRVSLGCWNTEEELSRFVEAVRELAGSEPGRLPPRRPIAIAAERP